MVWKSQKEVERIREIYPEGTKIRLLHMKNELYAPEAGTEGVVNHVDDIGSIHVNWSTGSSLALIYGVDEFVKI